MADIFLTLALKEEAIADLALVEYFKLFQNLQEISPVLTIEKEEYHWAPKPYRVILTIVLMASTYRCPLVWYLVSCYKADCLVSPVPSGRLVPGWKWVLPGRPRSAQLHGAGMELGAAQSAPFLSGWCNTYTV